MGGWLSNAEALQLGYDIGYRAEYSDNVGRIADKREGQSELINRVSAGLSLLENTSTLNGRIFASAAYDYYSRSTYDNQTTFLLDAYGEAFLARQTLSWVVADGFRRLQIDPQQPDTPTNRQNSNAFATGPNLYLRLGALDTVRIEGRYGRSWVENVDIDNDRYAYAGRWLHRISARSTLSVNYEHLDTDFENDTVNTDRRRHNYFVRAQVQDPRSAMTLDLGRTRIESDGFEPERNWLARLHASRNTGAGLTVGIGLRSEYSDTGAELLPSASGTGAGTGVPAVTTDVVASESFYVQEADVLADRAGGLFAWTARVFYRDLQYERTAADRQEKGLLVNLRQALSGTLSLQLSSRYSILSYADTMREDRDSEIGAALVYLVSQGTQLGLDYRRYGRRSSEPNQGYTDNRFGLTLMYGTGTARR